MAVTVDTMVLIWGVKKVATTGQEHMISRASRFLKWLDDRGDAMQLTAQVAAEYVGGFPVAQQAAQLALLRQYFPVHPFDLNAAAIAAELLYKKELIKGIQTEFGVSRQVVKADVAIVATAIAAKMGRIFSNDPALRKAAQGKIIVQDMPDISESRSLFNIPD